MIADQKPRSVLVAPDKFKGTLSAVEVSEAITRGLREVMPDARLYQHPVADGGEGTVDVALRHGFAPAMSTVRGPLGQEVPALFAVREDTAVMEMSAAAGLGLLGDPGPSPASALAATTYGVGQLVLAALDEGVTRIVLGLGGSATTDGGAGALQALGALITDGNGRTVPPGGGALRAAQRVDLSEISPRALCQAEIVVACDVEAVLTGPSGASAVFSPQKGADPTTVELLEESLLNWADLVEQAAGKELRHVPGTGAAGGLAFGLAAGLGARILPGVDVLLDISRFDQVVAECDLVVVGEGSLDAQSLLGKGPVGVARRAADLGVPSVAVVGKRSISEEEARKAGLKSVISLTDFTDERRCLEDTSAVITQVITNAFPELLGWI